MKLKLDEVWTRYDVSELVMQMQGGSGQVRTSGNNLDLGGKSLEISGTVKS